MPKKIELKPLAEVGRGYVIYDETFVEIHISGVLGVLKAWLIGKNNLPLGNIAGGKLKKNAETANYRGVLITQSGRQLFYGEWSGAQASEEAKSPCPYSPLPDLGWEKITSREYPTRDERVRFALSNDAFFSAFKKHGYYLLGRDGERYALAVRHSPNESSPFPCFRDALTAGDYIYVLL